MSTITKEQLIEDLKASTQNSRGMFEIGEETICALMSLLTTPPAPVSVPAAMEMDDDFDSAFEHGKAVGWNACRAAMLQGADGNSQVIPDGWVMVPEEPTHEMLEAGDEQFGTYDVYRRMIAASPQQEVKS